MLGPIHRLADGRDVACNAGRGLVVDDEHGFKFITLIRAQPLFYLV
jgi:hypothetical protein